MGLLVVAGVVYFGIKTSTQDHPIPGATPQEAMLNSLNFWLQHEGGHTVVLDPVLQEVADVASTSIQFVSQDSLLEAQQNIVSAENTQKVRQFIIAKGYRPAHIEESWGTGVSEEVAKNFLLDNPGRGAILERGNVYTRVGISEVMKGGQEVFFVILGTE